MFIGAPLLLVEVGANNIRKMLNDGDHSILKAWSKALIEDSHKLVDLIF